MSRLRDATRLSDVPLLETEGDSAAQEQTQQDLTYWAHVIESAHDDKTRSVALVGYQLAALQLAFGWL